jgi:gas vesicle protein
MSSGKLVLGVLVGVAVGATLGILFAPDKGSNTRKKISDKADDFTGDLKHKVDEFFDMLTEKFEQSKKETEDLLANGKQKFNSEKREMENKVM